MLRQLRDELANSFNSMRYGTELRTITVAKPYCAPARQTITQTFDQYGVKLYDYNEQVVKSELRGFLRRMKIEAKTWENLKYGPIAGAWLPMAWVAKVTVSAKAAVWAEYLLLRTGKLYVPGKYQNKRNAEWARKHGGVMPPAWQDGKPWIEKGCSEGMAAWEPLRKAVKK